MKAFMGKVLFWLLVILAVALLLSGCAAKGYIVTNIASVVGLDVSENPKTQVPHIRFGFVRSQYYYIPTGKAESGQGTPGGSGWASETPELVSDIDIEMQFLNYGKIKERFAVGPPAVKTNAAQALFGAQNIVEYQEELHEVRMELKRLIRQNPEKAKSCIASIAPGDPNRNNPELFVDQPPKPQKENLEKLRDCLKKS